LVEANEVIEYSAGSSKEDPAECKPNAVNAGKIRYRDAWIKVLISINPLFKKRLH
jgi:hypothetical protein